MNYDCYIGSTVRFSGDVYSGTGVVLEYVERTVGDFMDNYYIIGMQEFYKKDFPTAERRSVLNLDLRHNLVREKELRRYSYYASKGLWCCGPDDVEYLDTSTKGLIESLRRKVNGD